MKNLHCKVFTVSINIIFRIPVKNVFIYIFCFYHKHLLSEKNIESFPFLSARRKCYFPSSTHTYLRSMIFGKTHMRMSHKKAESYVFWKQVIFPYDSETRKQILLLATFLQVKLVWDLVQPYGNKAYIFFTENKPHGVNGVLNKQYYFSFTKNRGTAF